MGVKVFLSDNQWIIYFLCVYWPPFLCNSSYICSSVYIFVHLNSDIPLNRPLTAI